MIAGIKISASTEGNVGKLCVKYGAAKMRLAHSGCRKWYYARLVNESNVTLINRRGVVRAVRVQISRVSRSRVAKLIRALIKVERPAWTHSKDVRRRVGVRSESGYVRYCLIELWLIEVGIARRFFKKFFEKGVRLSLYSIWDDRTET